MINIDLLQRLKSKLKNHAHSIQTDNDCTSILVPSGEIPHTLKFLRDDPLCSFSILIDLCAVDFPQRTQRFEIVYHLLSITHNQRVRVKTRASEKIPVPSVSNLFPAAAWYEREAFDLFGVLFSGHPDLRRLLTDYGFLGHPLRKDFPLSGFKEVIYDESRQEVVYQNVQLAQEYRSFDFESPWEAMKQPPRSEKKE